MLALAPGALAQSTGASTLRGTVKDPSGDVVAGATVTLTSDKTETSRTVTTREDGLYVFAQIDPDQYTLKVEAPNFKTTVQSGLVLSPSETRGQDVMLEIGGTTDVVNITTEEQIQTETGEKSHTITSDQINNLSLIGRSSLELLRILPGVVSPEQADLESVGFNAGANANERYSVNGLRGVNNNVSIDGSRVIDIGSNNGTIITANNDMVQEVEVKTSNYAAEYGSSAIQISAVTKGGGKDFHGTLYDYWRPYQAAANDRSRNYNGLPRSQSRFQYPGGNIGGPVIFPGLDFNKDRDKMFFFFGLEFQRQVIAPDTRYANVPTLEQRQGFFGPNSGVRIPSGFPNAGELAPNGDLSPYIDPIGLALINLYPAPGGSFNNGQYNYATSELSPLNRIDMKLRVDYKISDRTNMYVRFARETETITYPYGVWWAASNYELPSPIEGTNIGRSLAVSVTTIINPTMVNEFVFSASRLKLDNDYKNPEKVTKEALGLGDYDLPFGEQVTGGVPHIQTGWGPNSSFWSPGGAPIFAYNDSFAITDNLSKVWGSHTMKFGGIIEQANKTQNFNSNAESRIVTDTWNPNGTGNVFGDLLVGRPVELNQETRSAVGHFRFYNVEGYAQDSWKVRPNFTLEYGVRISWFGNNTERDALAGVFNPSAYVQGGGAFLNDDPTRPNGILQASRGEIPKGISPDPGVKFAPRVNFAWDIFGDASTVIRGGGGLFYNRVQGNANYDVVRLPPNFYSFTTNVGTIPDLTFQNFGDLDPLAPGRIGFASFVSQDPYNTDLPRILTASFSLARRLWFDNVLEASYVGTFGRHLPQRLNINSIDPDALANAGSIGGVDLSNPLFRAGLSGQALATFRPYGAFDNVDYNVFVGTSAYNSLQVTLSRQQSERLTYFVAYTFSKVLGTTGSVGSANGGSGDFGTLDPVNTRAANYGVLTYDRTHIFNASYIIKVPNGAYGVFDNAVGRGFLNGWQISGITNVQSGRPMRPNVTGDYQTDATRLAYLGTPDTTLGINYLGDPNLGGSDVGEYALDADQIVIPGLGDPGTLQSPFYLRSPARSNTDITLFKNFDITESQRLEFRVGAFNIFNQAFPNPDLNDINLELRTECLVRVNGVPNGSGGTTDNVCDPRAGFRIANANDFGRINSKHGRRILEFAVKYYF